MEATVIISCARALDTVFRVFQQEADLMVRHEALFVPRLERLQTSGQSDVLNYYTNPRKLKAPKQKHRFSPSVLHIVTGGLGGIGLVTARWLAQRHPGSTLILTSRSGKVAQLSDALCREWDMLQAAARETLTVSCDMAEQLNVCRLMARKPHSAPPLEGVWHAAGVLADALLSRQDARALAVVFTPKAVGASTLKTAVCTEASLRTCMLFSSVAGLLGGGGQANYGAANACLDALASWCRQRGAASTSVQWGAWAEVGMAVRGEAKKRVEGMEKSSGVAPISLALGLAALGEAVQPAAPSVVCVLPVVWSRVIAKGQPAVPVLFSEFLHGAVEFSDVARDIGSKSAKRSRRTVCLRSRNTRLAA